MKRRLLSFILILCLAAPMGGTFMWLKYEKYKLRKEIKHQLIASSDLNDLEILTFSNEQSKNLNWEHSKEFEYQGEMYDVVKTEYRGDSVIYYCWWDHKETSLNKQLSELLYKTLGDDDERKDQEEKVIQYFKSLYCQSFPAIHLDYSPNNDPVWHSYEVAINDIKTGPAVPPPRA